MKTLGKETQKFASAYYLRGDVTQSAEMLQHVAKEFHQGGADHTPGGRALDLGRYHIHSRIAA